MSFIDIWQHRYRDSHIGKHIDKCIPYKAALHKTYNKPGGPSVPEKRTFLENHFSILGKNLYNYYDRITVEGAYINNLLPALNVQVPQKNCKFLCKCLSNPFPKFGVIPIFLGRFSCFPIFSSIHISGFINIFLNYLT